MSDRVADDPTLRYLARSLAPGLVTEVIDESRRAAVAAVRSRLTEALVEEITRLLADGPAPEADRSVGQWASEDTSRPPGGARAEGWYVYGLTWDEVAQRVVGHRGIDGSTVDALTVGAVAAVVNPISAPGPWGIDSHGDLDLEALAPRAQEHERVLEELLELGAVLPLRFGLLYPSLDQIRQLLEVHAPEIEAELGRLAGCSEWGLTVRSAGRSGSSAPVPSSQTAGGRGYLDRRRQERSDAERQRASIADAVDAIHESLLSVAADGVVLPALRSTSKAKGDCVLRGSYLVSGSGMDLFRSTAAASLEARPSTLGLSAELTGPWPPYHFTSVRLDFEVPA